MYSHQFQGWPHLEWDQAGLATLLADARYNQGLLLGKMASFGFAERQQATLKILTQDITKTSEIEGEILDVDTVRSSIARRLSVGLSDTRPVDRNVEGIVDVMLDATQKYAAPLTVERLRGWHTALFPTGRSIRTIPTDRWRKGEHEPTPVVSGAIGFLKWFNSPQTTDPVVQSALAHFRFITIHPFADGNGRIARAIADMLLARGESTAQRFYSMSAQIQRDRSAYYEILESSQQGRLNVSAWIEWYLNCLKRAIIASDEILESVLRKARFWKSHGGESFNERQQTMLNRMVDGFDGNLTSSMWARMTQCSQDTALRDITDLIDRNILVRTDAGGRSTNYRLR